jgi:hypothetical protein
LDCNCNHLPPCEILKVIPVTKDWGAGIWDTGLNLVPNAQCVYLMVHITKLQL